MRIILKRRIDELFKRERARPHNVLNPDLRQILHPRPKTQKRLERLAEEDAVGEDHNVATAAVREGAARGAEIAAFAANNVGTDFVGLWFGLPGPTAPICATCSTGLRIDLPILNFPGSRAINLPIPPRLDLVGLVLAGQAYAVGSGQCDSGLRLSDTIDFTLR